MKCDLHIHSQFSDGKLTIPQLVDLYGQSGFGCIAITDHLCECRNFVGRLSHGLNYSLSITTFSTYMEVIQKEAHRAWNQYGLLLIPGYEITKNTFQNHRSAHILILGTQEYIDLELEVNEILTVAKERGALTIAAHPFHTGDFEFQTFYLWSQKERFRSLIDAWEVNYRKKISPDVLNSGLPLIANSDFHHEGHFSSWKTKIYAKEKNQSSLFHAIRGQRLDFFKD